MFELEIFPGKINNNYLSSSINTDLNSILHQQGIEYCNSYFLINENSKITIRNFLGSNDEKGIIYMKKVYDRLYNNDISYSKDFDKKVFEKELDKVFYIILNNLFYFQLKKPGVNELNTSNNYNSSSRIFKQIFEESLNFLKNGEIIKIDFEYKKTNYSKFGKNIAFGKKMIFQNQIENEELFSNFTDKLEFVECYIKISTNAISFEEIKSIAKKNFDVYKNKFNFYKISNSKGSFLKLKNKLQIDSLISHSLIIPISNEYSFNNKSKILSYGIDITSNSLLKEQDKNYEIILGKIYENNIIENKHYLVLKDNLLKNKHSVIIGQSGSGKSYSLASIIAGKVIKSIKEFDYDKNYGDKIIIIDPHSSFGSNVVNIIKKYEGENKINNFSKIIYSKNIQDGFSYKQLVFNPLFIPNLLDFLNDEEKLLNELNYYSNTILTSIKGFYNENDFGARNQNLLKTFLNILIVLNLLKYEKYLNLKNKGNLSEKEKDELLSNSMLYSIGDIVDILNEILNGDIKNDIYESLKDLINNKNLFLNKLGDKFKKYLDYLINIVKKDKSFIDSTINKLDIFGSSLYKTFGGCSLINYTLDLQELFLKNTPKVEFINFDLGSYSSDEKSIISNFLMSYSYNFGTKRNLFDKKLGDINIYIDEVNSILSSQNSIDTLKKLYFEIRKYGISINSFFQNSKQKGFYDLYSNSGYVITFSNTKSEGEYLLGDFNSGSTNEIIVDDIINLNRGSFYILLKTINKNITLSCDGLDFNNEEDLKNIIS